jgi:hypothetical protein
MAVVIIFHFVDGKKKNARQQKFCFVSCSYSVFWRK